MTFTFSGKCKRGHLWLNLPRPEPYLSPVSPLKWDQTRWYRKSQSESFWTQQVLRETTFGICSNKKRARLISDIALQDLHPYFSGAERPYQIDSINSILRPISSVSVTRIRFLQTWFEESFSKCVHNSGYMCPRTVLETCGHQGWLGDISGFLGKVTARQWAWCYIHPHPFEAAA